MSSAMFKKDQGHWVPVLSVHLKNVELDELNDAATRATQYNNAGKTNVIVYGVVL